MTALIVQTQNLASLTHRQQQLLVELVKRHIATAEPVASSELASTAEVSSATVRHDMAALEEAGFVQQPHTSAGRVPTEEGFRFYVEQFKGKVVQKVWQSELQKLEGELHSLEQHDQLRALARQSSETVKAAAYVAFSPQDCYYTGLASLFQQPEFARIELACSLAEVLDHLSGTLQRVWNQIGPVTVHIGSSCPFGSAFATVVGRTSSGAVFGVLGPQRLDYERSLAMLNYITAR